MESEKDSQVQRALEGEQKTKKKRQRNKEFKGENSENRKPVSKNKQRKNANEKKKKANLKKEISLKINDKSEVFVFGDIATNKQASSLISELVNCYTNNSGLPEEEKQIVNKILHEKTVSVFSDILNKCVDKLYNKLINNETFKELTNKKVVKKDAFCQTDICYGDSGS